MNSVMAVVATVDTITVTWTKPDDYKESYNYILTWQSKNGLINVTTNDNKSTIYNLDPGSHYNFNVTTQTSDGTQGAPTGNSSCTSMFIMTA